jgi:5-methyltetrahydrofolate--homocysteine methyltransferase
MDKTEQFTGLLQGKRILVADGAWGTEMVRLGLKTGECPETWNIRHPDIIKGIARSYRDAGADIVLTNTFGGNRIKLKRFGLEDKVCQLNREGVRLSKECAGGALVFASVGPTGELLAPVGSLDEKEAFQVFVQQIQALVEADIDGIVIETMIDLSEALCALRAARHIDATIPVVVSMTFAKGIKGFSTIMGITPETASKKLSLAGAQATGANCGTGIRDFVEIARQMKPATRVPLWIKPNAGIPVLKDGLTVYPDSPEDMAGCIKDIIDAGASIIGGCCGTTPAHIRAIAEEVRKHRTRNRKS